MSKRIIKLKQNSHVEACPKCGNNTEFVAHSRQAGEDYCYVWVECKCGFDPADGNCDYYFEDVWGGVDNNNVMVALSCWNDAVNDYKKTE